MKSWQLEGLGGNLNSVTSRRQKARPGGVLLRVECSSLMSYLKDYVEGNPVANAHFQEYVPRPLGPGLFAQREHIGQFVSRARKTIARR